MPRNDRSDSFSVRADDDPRRPLKALQQETEREFGASEAHDSGGAEHRGADERAGRERPEEPGGGGTED